MTSYFASGTGAAGLVGAFLWWELRGLGVRVGVGLSAVRRQSITQVSMLSEAQIAGSTLRHSIDLLFTPPESRRILFPCILRH